MSRPAKFFPALIVNQVLVDDKRSAIGQRLIRLPQQRPLLVETPVVQDHPHDQHIRLREWFFEEVATMEREAPLKLKGSDVLLEKRADGGQIKTLSSQVRIRKSDSNSEAPLCGADIGKGLVPPPRKFAPDSKS
jgi:hypothetical protein